MNVDEFDWQSFLSFAEEIFERHHKINVIGMNEETECRIGISRAYYAVFHKAEDFISAFKSKFHLDSRDSPHERVINAFKNSDNRYYRKIAINLSKMKELRIRADYVSERYKPRYEDGNVIGELEKILAYAKSTNKMIDRCRQNND